MATETPPMDDAALFSAATAETPATPEAPQEAAPAVAAPEAPQDGRPRDEQGRFLKAESAAPAATPVAQPEPSQPPADHIPSWRLREESEARRAAETRMAQYEARARQMEDQLRQFTEKPREPIDPFADPQRFRDEGIAQHVGPIQQEMMRQREYFSRELAVTKHGEEAVKQAYDWLEKSIHARDPRAMQTYQQVMGTMDPYGELIKVHKRESVASDPEAWLKQELRLAGKDPTRRQELLQLLSGGEAQPGQSAPTRNVVQLPPSLNRTGGSAAPNGGGSMDDASLFAHAMGR